MCNFASAPAILFASSSDVSDPDVGLACSPVDNTLYGASGTAWAIWFKIARLIEGIP